MKLINRNSTEIIDSIGYWELNRIIYNLYMLIIGFISFYIGFISIPFIYILIGVTLNLMFTFSWIGELLFIRPFRNKGLTKIYTISFILIFYGYSTFGVLFFAKFPRLLMWCVDLWMPFLK